MKIAAIVARANNQVIGIKNRLPWRIPGDLKWFRRHTLNHHVILGRKSFESLGKPLPDRVNIVITRDRTYYHSGCIIVHSIDQALITAHDEGEKEVFILGGGKIYAQTKKIWDRLYLTEVDANPVGDTYFPEIDLDSFTLIFEEKHQADLTNELSYTFKIYDRIK